MSLVDRLVPDCALRWDWLDAGPKPMWKQLRRYWPSGVVTTASWNTNAG